jgi:integrase
MEVGVAGGSEQKCTLSDRSDRLSWEFAFRKKWPTAARHIKGTNFATRLTRSNVVAPVLNVHFCSDPPLTPHLTVDPTDADEVRLRSIDRDLDGKTFTVAEVDLLLDAASRQPADNQRSYWPVRDVAVVSVLAFCGLRVSELSNLTTASYVRDVERPVLKVRGSKGGKGRIVPIPTRTVETIDAYLVERAEEAGPSPRSRDPTAGPTVHLERRPTVEPTAAR